MTTQERKVMELALEALEELQLCTDDYYESSHEASKKGDKAITAIKEALAQPEEAQSALSLFQSGFIDGREKGLKEALAQPQRKPLTDSQYIEIGQRHWLPSIKVEQIHKELEEAAHNIKE